MYLVVFSCVLLTHCVVVYVLVHGVYIRLQMLQNGLELLVVSSFACCPHLLVDDAGPLERVILRGMKRSFRWHKLVWKFWSIRGPCADALVGMLVRFLLPSSFLPWETWFIITHHRSIAAQCRITQVIRGRGTEFEQLFPNLGKIHRLLVAATSQRKQGCSSSCCCWHLSLAAKRIAAVCVVHQEFGIAAWLKTPQAKRK